MDKLWRKMKTNANVEQTQMTKEFTDSVTEYDQYKELADEVVKRFENILQQNPGKHGRIEHPASEHPMEKLAGVIGVFSSYFNGKPDKTNALQEAKADCLKLSAIHRRSQESVRGVISHLREFKEYHELKEERKKLEKAREVMDNIRHEVKQVKTTEQIEKKSDMYENAVGDFDQQASKVIDLLGKLPQIKKVHQKEIDAFFDHVGTYNDEVVKATKK